MSRRLLRSLKLAAFRLLNETIRTCVPRGRSNDILVLKLDALGDLFIWFASGIVNVAEYCRSRGGRSVILVRPELAEFVGALGLFDEVEALDAGAFLRNPLYRASKLAALRQRGFREVLQVRVSRQFLLEDSIARAVGAPSTRGPVGDRRNLPEGEAAVGDAYYSPIVRFAGSDGHDIERNARVASALTGKPPARFELPAHPTPRAHGAVPSRDYFIVAPGAGWAPRRWPASSFAEIARRGVQRGLLCVVTGDGRDVPLGAKIVDALGGDDVMDACGRLDLRELADFVRGARCVIGNDSGIIHIAAYLGVPSVAALGGGHFGWFLPYPEGAVPVPPRAAYVAMDCFGCNWHCRYKLSERGLVPCIDRLDVEAVWREVEPLLGAPRAA